MRERADSASDSRRDQAGYGTAVYTSSRLPGVTISDAIGPGAPSAPTISVEPREAAPTGDVPEGLLQLFVNVGKRDGVRADDLQKLLTERGVPIEAASGILLLVTTVVALVWKNSRFARSYEELWRTRITPKG